MKTLCKIFPILLLIFILPPKKSSGADEYTKVISKEYAINRDAQVNLDNKFGQIHCNNWDKNSISIEVKITVTASGQESANRIFSQVNIVMSGTPAQVDAKTIFEKEGSFGRSKISIDYTVNMPATVNLNLTDKFGDVYLNELSGKGNLHIAYGNMEINKLSNSDNVIEVKFGKADIQSVSGAVLTVKYSDVKIDYAGSLFVDSKYSDLTAKKIISLSVTFEGGNLNLDNSSVITAKSKFSDLTIGHIDKKLDLDIQYGDCDVNDLSADFSSITVYNKYGDVKLQIPSGTSYSLDAQTKFCDVDFPEEQANITEQISTNTSKSIKATIGKNLNPEAKVYVRSEFGDVTLK